MKKFRQYIHNTSASSLQWTFKWFVGFFKFLIEDKNQNWGE